MKKLLILCAAAFLLVNCDNAKNSTSDNKDKDSTSKKDEKKADIKKPDPDKPVVIDNHFKDVKPEQISENDEGGWPEARRAEVLSDCKQDIGDDGPEATAYCNCQLQNAMKIFKSYKEAATIFNKTEEEITQDEMKKIMELEQADMNCINQHYEDDMNDEGDQKDGQ